MGLQHPHPHPILHLNFFKMYFECNHFGNRHNDNFDVVIFFTKDTTIKWKEEELNYYFLNLFILF